MRSARATRIVRWLLMSVAVLSLAACGGQLATTGSSDSSTGRASVTILWPERNRLVPLVTESIRVGIRSAQGVTLVEQTVNRPPVGTTSTVQFSQLPVGGLMALATAFPQTDGRGTPVASGVAELQVRPYTTAAISLTMATTISYLAFTPSALQLTVGDAVDLAVTAYDANGSVVLMAPVHASWTVSNLTVLSSTPTGFICRLGAIGAGPATVTFADGETGKSASLSLSVAAIPIRVVVSPALASVQTNGTRQFAAQVDGTTDKRVSWSIDEGPAGGSVSATGLYSAPASAGGPYRVRATSVADPSKSAAATVTVTQEINTGNGEVEIR